MIRVGAKHFLVMGRGTMFDRNVLVSASESHFSDGYAVLYVVNDDVADDRVSYFMSKKLESAVFVSSPTEIDMTQKKIFILKTPSSPNIEVLDAIQNIIELSQESFFAFDTINLDAHSICDESTSVKAILNGNRIGVRCQQDNSCAKIGQQMHYEIFAPVGSDS